MIFGARPRFWAVLAAVLIALGSCDSEAAEPPRVEPFLQYAHVSDILRGPPFFSHDKYDPTMDAVTIGATITWRRVELDMSHGVKTLDRGPLQSGTALAVRWYFRRAR